MPPQRRDMWRHIIKHVRSKEEVDLIKKSLLLHKLQKRQKPLMVRHIRKLLLLNKFLMKLYFQSIIKCSFLENQEIINYLKIFETTGSQK
jgi:hypothetical protein